MKNIYRILSISLALALLLTLPVIVACDGGSGNGVSTTATDTSAETTPDDTSDVTTGGTSDETTVNVTSADTTADAPDLPVTPTASVSAVENGKPKFVIVRGENADENELAAAKYIWDYFRGLFPTGNIDFIDDFKTYDESRPAIVVGRTSYPETREALSGISYGDGAIRVVKNKIVVTAWDSSALGVLGEDFTKLADSKLSSDKSTLTLTSDDAVTKTFREELAAMPSFDGKAPSSTVDCGNGAHQVYIENAAKSEFDAYVAKLKSAGYETVSEREVAGNLFFTGKTASNAITAYFMQYNRSVRVIVEPVGNLPLSDTGRLPYVTTPKLTMIGRRFSTTSTYLGKDSGAGLMCFMIRLSDGRFVVIDGGTSQGGFNQALYSEMLKQAPDPQNIVIAAWIFTHSHGDHVGGFYAFTDAYKSVVKLERIIYNFPSEADAEVADDEWVKYQTINRYFSEYRSLGVPIYKVHTGQVLTYGDARFEFYYTHEDYVTATRTVQSTTNWNNTSLIFSCDIAGERIMFLGDAQEVPNNQTTMAFGSYLKSDIVQVAHHGGVGGTKPIYAAIDPEIALFTTTDALLPVYISKWDYNDYLVNGLHVKEYYNSYDRIRVWDLPYHAASSGFIK